MMVKAREINKISQIIQMQENWNMTTKGSIKDRLTQSNARETTMAKKANIRTGNRVNSEHDEQNRPQTSWSAESPFAQQLGSNRLVGRKMI
ncbi:hypothetical protein ZHAS_00006707 [Anopheles sinensis]|uniref:Uncharacterized protein n=1 Tax=Anopheles sinensis TaxID=74873 RepID=A0A084VM06_ANOSI|nr:hypothetical protein ZHAS_00006707 [Anopheles sinensis]